MNSQSGCFCLRSRFCLQCLRPQHWTGCPQPHLYTCFQDLTFRPLEDGHAIGTTRWCSCWLDFATITQVGWTEDPGSEMQTLQSCQEDGRPSQHHPLAPGASPTTQGSSRYNIHPILGMTLVELERDGTVVRVYGPPLELIVPYGPRLSLLQENLRVKIPQLLYIPGASRRGWVRKSSVLFFMRESLGVRLPDALGGKVEGMDDQGGAPLENCNVISIRMHLPGYESSTEVEKTLKEQWESNGREKARSMRVSTRINGAPATNGKLLKEVSKRIQWHIWDLENNKDLFPFDSRVGEHWRLGQGRMKPEYMVITGLRNVSTGSWSPVIELDPCGQSFQP